MKVGLVLPGFPLALLASFLLFNFSDSGLGSEDDSKCSSWLLVVVVAVALEPDATKHRANANIAESCLLDD